MFEIITVFTRPDAEVEFFYEVQGNHPIVKEIQQRYYQTPGSKGLSVKYKDREKIEISMAFETAKQFLDFVDANKDLLEKRKQLIDEWCSITGHTYSFYTIDS